MEISVVSCLEVKKEEETLVLFWFCGLAGIVAVSLPRRFSSQRRRSRTKPFDYLYKGTSSQLIIEDMSSKKFQKCLKLENGENLTSDSMTLREKRRRKMPYFVDCYVEFVADSMTLREKRRRKLFRRSSRWCKGLL